MQEFPHAHNANKTWLVLAIGILLVAFPTAHGAILTALYLPVAVMLVGFFGMAYSFYPFIVSDHITIYEAANAPENLFILLIGTLFVLPMILGYTALADTVFRGKATGLSHD